MIKILERKVFVKDKWMRLSDAIEDIIDSYISFLNEDADDVLFVDLSRGTRDDS